MRRFLLVFVVLSTVANGARAQSARDTTVVLRTAAGLQYAPNRLVIRPKTRLRLVLQNDDDMAHNLVLVQPNTRRRVVEFALALGEKGPARSFVPDMPEVIAHTRLLEPGERDTLTVTLPEGDYPFVCTYPGHGQIMYGVLYVTATPNRLPSLAEDTNLPNARLVADHAGHHAPESGHPYPLTLPAHYRTFMPNCGPAAIAVGLPGGMSYCWDAGTCRLRYAWSGGFVDNRAQWDAKGQQLTKIVGDIFYTEPERANPWRIGGTFSDVRFRGYRLVNRYPEFQYTVGGVLIRELNRALPGRTGLVRQFTIAPTTKQLTLFVGNQPGVVVKVSVGTVRDGLLTLPAGTRTLTLTVSATGSGTGDVATSAAKPAPRVPFRWQAPLAATSGTPALGTAVPGADYVVEPVPTPPGLVAETGGITFLPDGRMAACFRRGEVLLYNPKTSVWTQFAEGLHDPLGILAVSNRELLVMQRPELTRLTDTDGDGQADRYETVTDAFGMTGNYHEFGFGLVRDRAGNLYISLNTASNGAGIRDELRGRYDSLGRPGRMYACVPYRGWVLQIRPDGTTVPFASGFRSPDGLGVDPQGRLLVTDNQGDWLGTSKLYHVQAGSFYGHPSSLVWNPAFPPVDPLKLPVRMLDSMRTRESWAFPHARLAHSPTQVVWDNTGGRFGPFAGQTFVGEMDYPHLLRVLPDEVDGAVQGASLSFPVGTKLPIGNHRLAFAPDGSLWIGQTDHGWTGARGLYRLRYVGKTTPLDVAVVRLTPTGFDLTFTRTLDEATAQALATYRVERYYYEYHRDYGSKEFDKHDVPVTAARLSPDRKTVSLTLTELKSGYLYDLTINGLLAADNPAKLTNRSLTYTLNQLVPVAQPSAGR